MKNKSKKPEKLYTFRVLVSFETQFTFLEKEVEHDEGGNKNDFEPTDKALLELEKEIEEYLLQNYSVDKVEVWADSDDLLGVNEEPED